MKQRHPPCYDEYLAECSENPVAKKVKAKRFVSHSKGWRNGKQRIRREEKGVILVNYIVTIDFGMEAIAI